MRRALALSLAMLAASCGGRSSDPVVRLRLERDPNLRQKALLELVERGPGATGLWGDLLREPDAEIARMTATAIGRAADRPQWRDPPAELLDLLLEASARREPAVRAEAVTAAADLWAEDARVPRRLLGTLMDPDPGVRRAALRAFRTFGPSTAGMDLEPLRGMLGGEASLAEEAALALAACGDGSPAAVDRLASTVADPADPARAVEAAGALSLLGPRAAGAAPAAAKALPGAPEGLAAPLAHALGLMGDRSPAVVEALGRALRRREPPVAVEALLALVRLGIPAGKEAAALPGWLAAGPPVSVHAAEADSLMHVGTLPAGARAVLLAAAGPGGGSSRAEALLALGRLGAAGTALPREALAALEDASRDPSLAIRRAALRAQSAAGGK